MRGRGVRLPRGLGRQRYQGSQNRRKTLGSDAEHRFIQNWVDLAMRVALLRRIRKVGNQERRRSLVVGKSNRRPRWSLTRTTADDYCASARNSYSSITAATGTLVSANS